MGQLLHLPLGTSPMEQDLCQGYSFCRLKSCPNLADHVGTKGATGSAQMPPSNKTRTSQARHRRLGDVEKALFQIDP
jgi:hypothetical protein